MARLTKQEKQDIIRYLELKSVFREYTLGRRKLVVKVVDLLGNER